jgi:hypothetical protein
MKLHVEIQDDDGVVLYAHDADHLSTPSRWNIPTGQRLVSKMPSNASDVENSGTYEIFGITFQPHLRVDRPNGWTPSPPGPNSGPQIPTNFPIGLPSVGRAAASLSPQAKPISMWGTSSAPTPQTTNSQPGFAPTRG